VGERNDRAAAPDTVEFIMNRSDVIAKLKAVEPALRARGVGALYLFGSYSRDDASAHSDVDIFVDPDNEEFYGLENYMGAYEQLQRAFPGTAIGYSTRDALSKHVRRDVEQQAIRVF
jgi:predicted nucleotidyltransferase